MPKLVGSIVIVCLLATALHAKELEWQGSLSLSLSGLDVLSGSGTGVATLSEGFSLETLAIAGGIAMSEVIPFTDPIVTAGGAVELRLSAQLGTGTLGIDPYGASSVPTLSPAALPVAGAIRVCLFFSGCNSGSLTLPFTRHESGLGLGGTVAAAPGSLLGAPWTIQTASVRVPLPTGSGTSTTLYAFGTIHGPRSFTFTAASTESGVGGSIQLVSPVRIEGFTTNPAAGFARLQLRFAPEPSLPATWFFGSATLAILGVARRKCRGRPPSSWADRR